MIGHEVLPATIVGAFGFGMTAALMGSLRHALDRAYLGKSAPAPLSVLFHVSLIPSMVLSGVVTDVAGVRWTLIGGSLILGIALFILSMGQNHPHVWGGAILAAVGTAGVGTSVVKLMPLAFFDGNPAASLNLGYIFVGLGALLAPVLAEILGNRLSRQRSLAVFSLISLIPAATAILTADSHFSLPRASLSDIGWILPAPGLWLAGLVFTLYIVLEGSITAWVLSCIRSADSRIRTPTLLLPGFWLAVLASRLVISLMQQKWLPEDTELWVIIVLAILAAAAMGNVMGSEKRTQIGWATVALGVFIGPILPTLIALVFKEVAASSRAMAFGMMFGVGSAGSLVAAPLAAAYAARLSLRLTLRVPLTAALILAAATLVLGLTMSTLLL